MRLRASIENVPIFLRIIQTVERLTKTCILKFSPTHMRIICDKPGDGGIQVWSIIKVSTLFKDYRIQSNSNDEITIKIGSEPLIQALKSASTSPEVVVKLAKKNDHAVLSFEIIVQTRQNKKASVTQDVNIEVMRPADVESLKEPMCPEPDVHIFLPPLSKLRAVTDHLRQLSDIMGVSANGNGHLRLFIETDAVKVDTEWSDCKNPPIERGEDEEPVEPEAYATTLVSVKSFLKFLSSHIVSTTTIACICHNYCIIMYVYVGKVEEPGDILTFYIPAIHDGIDN
ncbi:checkpoint protein Hus1/Mec3 [Hysterangium stoloniferum]|nr:checkpoint protein Hus1/Mec3 [Hysterangium stoloniferum]